MNSNLFYKLYFFLFATLCIFSNIYEIINVKIELPNVIGYFDEIIIVILFIPAFIFLSNYNWLKVSFILFLLLLLLSLSWGFVKVGEFRFNEVLIQSFINFKFYFLFVIFLYLTHINIGNAFIKKILVILISISLFGALLNFIFSDYFQYSEYLYAIERQRIIGFQYKPNDFALLISFFTIYLIFSSEIKTKVKVIFLLLIFLLILYSTSRVSMMIFIISLFLFMFHRHMFRTLIIGSLLSLFLIFLFYEDFVGSFFYQETILNFSELSSIDTSQYIRGIMIYLGYNISLDHFPFGYGAGTFGTVMSYNSPVYSFLGVSNLNFFQNMEGIYDSNTASILGEYGYIGVAVYTYISYRMIKNLSEGVLALLFLYSIIFFYIATLYPFFSYNVNFINFLLSAFCLKNWLAVNNKITK